ncbi:MAG: NAD-dependent epimerase/dehydratase family protein [Elusimicrobia bacterium]|nr:NAD-dependent epimerase/dehydratase family protein [Elusimicrobiota bacterium]
MQRALITGANGFVGHNLCCALSAGGHVVRGTVRNLATPGRGGAAPEELIEVSDIGPQTDWHAALRDVDVVIHLAARAHVLRETVLDPLLEFRRVNVMGTQTLAKAAVQAGVKRFVFLSTIGICGLSTPDSVPFDEGSPPRPAEPYALSKWEAEQALRYTCRNTGMEAVVLRPPLVYGPGPVKGNMQRLLDAVQSGRILPLGAIRNSRSFIGMENLVAALTLCATAPAVANQTFVISDGMDVSTPDLIRKIARAMGKQANLWMVPRPCLSLAGAIFPHLGRALKRLSDSLLVDSKKFRKTMGWAPPKTLDQGIESMVSDYLAKR